MPLLNYTTSIDASKTAGQIIGILATHGASAIMSLYDGEGNITGVSFTIRTPAGELPFRLPIDAEACYQVLRKEWTDGKIPPRYVNLDHARRVAWRIIKDWVEAQMALLETEMVRLEQIFLPYLLVNKHQTLFEQILENKFLLPERTT